MHKGAQPAEVVEEEFAGVRVVTIPLLEYVDLLECRRRLSEISVQTQDIMRQCRSIFGRNPEMAVYLASNFGLKPLKEILDGCHERFGREATPSIRSAYRYLKRLREEASNDFLKALFKKMVFPDLRVKIPETRVTLQWTRRGMAGHARRR